MRRILTLLLFIFIPEAKAVPVVPNFSQGSMTSHTETTSKVTETINSIDYQTGWQYTVTGNNIEHSGDNLLPPAVTNTGNTINGISSSWTSLDATQMPSFSIKDSTKPFQATFTLSQPGLSTQTIIQRVTEITSVTDTTSTFSQ
tara:strand:+ start:906 stop:1337 length:432 start_codon:yes stop_codon:yes gene_type:complete